MTAVTVNMGGHGDGHQIMITIMIDDDNDGVVMMMMMMMMYDDDDGNGLVDNLPAWPLPLTFPYQCN